MASTRPKTDLSAISAQLIIKCNHATYNAISLIGSDKLSEDSCYTITVDTIDIEPLNDGLGQSVTMEFIADDGFAHSVCHTLLAIEDKGLISASPEKAAEQITLVANAKRRYELTIGSRLSLLDNTQHSRVFVDTSLEEILTHILAGAGYHHGQIQFSLATPLPQIGQCVQAMENNRAFFNRLLSQYGLFYFFDTRDNQSSIVITDTNQTSPYLGRGLVQVHAGEGFNRQITDIYAPAGESAFVGFSGCQVDHQMATGLASIMSHDMVTDASDNQAEHLAENNFAQPVASNHGLASHFAQQQSLALNSLNQVITLVGNVPDMFAGCSFSLSDNSGLNTSGDYLCICVEHHCQQPSDESTQDGLSQYTCVVKAIPRATPFKLPLAEPAPLPMVFSAKVEALGGVPTLTEQGDYYTKFDVDKTAQAPLGSTQPLRKLVNYACANQPHATGWHFPLTQDAQVLLGCFNNDPTQAYLMGFASNDEQPSIVNSFNHTHNRMLSRAGHELRFDDDGNVPTVILQTLGGEHYLELNAKAGNNYIEWASRLGSLSLVAGDDILFTSDEQSINLNAKANQQFDIKGVANLTAEKQNVAMQSALAHQQTANNITFEAEQDATLLTGRSVNVRADSEIALQTEQGSLTVNVPEGSTIINAEGDIRIEGTGSGDITLFNQGGMIKLDSGGNVELIGSDVLTLNGQMITFDGDVTYEITSPKTASEPSANSAPSIAPIADLPLVSEAGKQVAVVPLELNYFDSNNDPVDDIGVEILDSLGQLHTGTLQAGLLTLPDLPIGQCQISYLGTTDVDEQQLIQLREDFKQHLADMIAEVKVRAAREDALFEQESLFTQWAIGVGARLDGLYYAGKSLITGLADMVVMSLEFQSQMLAAVYNIRLSILNGDKEAVKQQLETLLAHSNKQLADLQLAADILLNIMDDEETRTALYHFPFDYIDAHSFVDKQRIYGILAFEVLLAILTGGVGVAASIASKSKYVIKAHKTLTEIADILKRKRLNRQQTHALAPSNTKAVEKIEAPVTELEKHEELGSKERSNKSTYSSGKYKAEPSAQLELAPKQLAIFDEMYSKAPAAKKEIDFIAQEIANIYANARVAKAPLKSRERAIQKIVSDYGGDPTRIKDLARNTIIVSEDNIENVVGELIKNNFKVKRIDGSRDPLGYSGINSTLKTKTSITGEIQVNTPTMIYGKESENIARLLLGNVLYDNIKAKSKVPGGQGHLLYEEWRSLPESDPNRELIAAKSKAYYSNLRSLLDGN